MAKFKKYEIGSEDEIQINVGEHIAADHMCRTIEQLINELDVSLIEEGYSDKGQHGLAPKLLLCIIFWGYIAGKRSGRKLEEACRENIVFIYLSKGYRPGKTCINDFRKNNYMHFDALFTQLLRKFVACGTAAPDISIVDGSVMEANSSKKQTRKKAKLEKWREHLDEDIASLERELSAAPGGEVEKKLETTRDLCEKIDGVLAGLPAGAPPDTGINLTEPDAPILKCKKGYFDTAYNVQVACNEGQIILYANVVTLGNDKAQLVPGLKGAASNTGRPVGVALADADYGTLDSFEYMAGQNITGYVPFQNMDATFGDKPYHSAHFIYDADRNTYTCPEGETLERFGQYTEKRSGKTFDKYRCDACKTCPFQKQCCEKGTVRRVIKRETREHLRDEMKERLNSEEGKQMYARRMHPVEAIFGHLKFNLGYTRFLLRGLEKVRAEFTIMCIAFNLRKFAKVMLLFFLNGDLLVHTTPQHGNMFTNPIFQRTFFSIRKKLYVFT